MSASISVIIMAFNEQNTIKQQIDNVVNYFVPKSIDFEVVVVDDGSTDRTADIVQHYGDSRVKLVRHERNMGMGAAIRDGYKAAVKDFVTQLPADLQVTPEQFDPFLDLIHAYDLILSTYRRRDDGFIRKIVSTGFRAVSWTMLGYWCSITGTMFIRRSLLQNIEMRSNTFLINCEIPLRLMRLGIKPAFVKIEAQKRGEGGSKVLNLKKISLVLKEMYELRRSL